MKNIVLLGFMGTGKSIIGRRLAVELRYRFVDTDHLIEKMAQKRVPKIFAEDGEAHFRKLESQVVDDVSDWEGYVISTGGGVPLNPGNMTALRKNGIVVALTARPKVILKRVQRRAGERPLLQGPDPLGNITRLLSEREKYYAGSEIQVDTSDMQIAESVHCIMDRITQFTGGGT
ncbi:MAG: shikimate kinase [Nitrospiria bacterium]